MSFTITVEERERAEESASVCDSCVISAAPGRAVCDSCVVSCAPSLHTAEPRPDAALSPLDD